MKTLLTIVFAFLCFAGKAQEDTLTVPQQHGLNLEFSDLNRLLLMDDNTMDNYLTAKDWSYMTHRFDTARRSYITEYVFGRDTYGGVKFQLSIRTDTNGVNCAVNLLYVEGVKLNNYFINQAVKNGFKYVDALKEKDELLKFYANANTHVCFVAFSKANGEGVAENGRLFTTQSFTDAIVTEKRYRQFRLEKGMDTK